MTNETVFQVQQNLPAVNAFLSAIPVAGKGAAVVRWGAIKILSSSTVAAGFVDVIVGEKGTKTK